MIKPVLVFIALQLFTFTCDAQLIPSEDLFDSSYASMADISPDGKRVSMMVNEDGKRRFSLKDVASNTQYLVENMGKVNYIREYEWVNDELLHISSNTGQYFVTLSFKEDNYHADVKKIPYPGYVAHIFAETNQVLFAKSRPWESGGYTLHLEDIDKLLAKKLNVKKHIAGPQRRVSYFAYNPQKKQILASTYDKGDKSVTIEYRTLDNKKWVPIVTLLETDFKFTPVTLIDKSTLAVLTNKTTDKVALFEYDLETASLGKLLYEHPKFDLVSAKFRFDGKTSSPMSVSYYDHGRYTVEHFNEQGEALSNVIDKAFSGKQWYISATNSKTDQLIIRTYGSDDPGTYHLYNITEDSSQFLYSVFPKLAEYQFAKTQVEQVKVNEELEVEAYLTKANGKRHNVLLVNPHGGPVGVREDTFFDPVVQFYANRGFDTLQVNFRGSSGFGKKFLESGRGQFGQAIEQDITAAVENLLKKRSYDHVCAMGTSYGGYSSFMLATQHPELYSCVISAFGIYDLPLLYNASNLKVLDHHRKRVEGTVGEFNEELVNVSPVYLADKIKAPLFLIAGRRDKIAEFEHSNRLLYVLNRLNKPVETLFYWGTAHGQSSWKAERHQQLSIHEYLLKTLQLDDFKELTQHSDEKQIESIISDYILLADAFTFNDSVDNDSDKAKALYLKAAKLGNGRAMYNYAWQLSNNLEEGKSIEDVVSWYEKSHEAGFDKAGIALSQMYREGTKIEQNHEKAFSWLERAKERNSDKKEIDWEIGKALCFGHGVTQDIDKCLANLSERNKLEENAKKEGNSSIRYVGSNKLFKEFEELVMSEQFTPEQHDQIIKHVAHEFRLDNTKLTFEAEEIGVFVHNKLHKATTTIKASEDLIFGLMAEIKTVEMFGSNRERIALYYKWTEYNQQDEQIDQVTDLLKGYEGDWDLKFKLRDNIETSTRFVLDVYDLEQNLLHSETFYIQP